MTKNYDYPIDYTWTHDEIAKVITLLNHVEQAYEGGVSPDAFLAAYAQFKTVVPSIGEEKRIGREFEQLSGYVMYKVVQAAKQANGKKRIQLGE